MSNTPDNEQFPGYPHYPANEDITRANNNNGKKSLDAQGTGNTQEQVNDTTDERDPARATTASTDADVTEDDLLTLQRTEQNMSTNDSINLTAASLDAVDDDGDPLNEPGSLYRNASGDELDVPGAESDDDNERIGEEDEENNYYSLGGDNHEAQEESKE